MRPPAERCDAEPWCHLQESVTVTKPLDFHRLWTDRNTGSARTDKDHGLLSTHTASAQHPDTAASRAATRVLPPARPRRIRAKLPRLFPLKTGVPRHILKSFYFADCRLSGQE